MSDADITGGRATKKVQAQSSALPPSAIPHARSSVATELGRTPNNTDAPSCRFLTPGSPADGVSPPQHDRADDGDRL